MCTATIIKTMGLLLLSHMTAIQFETEPYAIGQRTIVRLPKEASEQLPSRGQVMVTGTINGQPFSTPLEPDGNLSHWFEADNAMQAAAGVTAGNPVRIALAVTKEWPEPEIPLDVQTALDANPEISELWRSFTPMARHEWLRWINSTAQPATRQKRIEVSCSKMLRGWRRPCCFNRNMCCVPAVSKSGVLLDPATV